MLAPLVGFIHNWMRNQSGLEASMTTPVLFGHPFSSYTQKALTAFYEKDAPFAFRMLDNAEAMAELKALWPIGRFPVVRAEGRALIESSVIIEWLDHARPAPRLIPDDPDAALEVRMLDRIFDNQVMASMQTLVGDALRPEGAKDPYGAGKAGEMLDTVYAWLDARLAGRAWAAGEAFSLADCAAASLFYADWVRPFEAHPTLYAYFQRLLARPSFARCVEEARPYRHLFPLGAPERPW
jgi:glutathione S-transferase